MEQEELLYLTPVSDQDDPSYILSEEYLAWRRAYPVGALLAKRLEKNKRKPPPSDLYQLNQEEKQHIANPLDYLGTKPDSEVRWKK